MKNSSLDKLKSKMQSKSKSLVGKQKNLDVNKNGKLDAEDFKMLRGKKMAMGGEVNIIETKFNSHKNHNPNVDILEGKIDKDSFITYYVYVKGNEIGKEGMEYFVGSNYVVGSSKKSSSRRYDVDKIPSKYKKAWDKLKSEYNEKHKDSMAKGGEVDDFYDNLQVHVQGAGTIYHGQSMKAAIKKADAYLLKNPKAEVVIVDEKYGDEYDLEGNQVENEDEYKNGGIMADGGETFDADYWEGYNEEGVGTMGMDTTRKLYVVDIKELVQGVIDDFNDDNEMGYVVTPRDFQHIYNLANKFYNKKGYISKSIVYTMLIQESRGEYKKGGMIKGDIVEYEGKSYKIASFDNEANLVYLNTLEGKAAEDSKGDYLKVNKTRIKIKENKADGVNGKTINGYDVDYFKTARGVYANIEIPSPNPTFDDDTQIKGFGKDEKEAFNDLKKEFEKYLKSKDNKMAKGGNVNIGRTDFVNKFGIDNKDFEEAVFAYYNTGSQDNMERISSRLKLSKLQKKLGEDKNKEVMEYIKDKYKTIGIYAEGGETFNADYWEDYYDGDKKHTFGGLDFKTDVKNSVQVLVKNQIKKWNENNDDNVINVLGISDSALKFVGKKHYISNSIIDAMIMQEGSDKMAKGGYVKVVLDEGNGKVINQLYNQWDNVKNQNQYDKWVTKVKNTRFGTYGNISIEEVLEKFDFDNAPINSFHLETFKKELKSALNGGKMADGGRVKSKEDVKKILDELKIYNYTINDDLSVDVDGNVNISNKELTKIPINFNKVTGYFFCQNNNLTSLKGSPIEVGDDFRCENNELTTLNGSPEEIKRIFFCQNNKLTSLEGGPKIVRLSYYCSNNELTTLKGSPEEIKGTFRCENNKLISLKGGPKKVKLDFIVTNNKLTSLKDSPIEVGGDFYCENNELTSLEGGPKIVGDNYLCQKNNLISLKGSPEEINRSFYCENNKLTSLEGGPKKVGYIYDCRRNNLTSLKGVPEEVVNFYCSNNKLTSLEGGPKIVKKLYVCDNNELTSLKGSPKILEIFDCQNNKLISLEGGPEEINRDFNCENNKLTSLEGGPKIVILSYYCSNNELTTLKGSPEEIKGSFICENNKLTSLEGGPKKVKIHFYCYGNPLTTLNGAPKKIGGNFLYKLVNEKDGDKAKGGNAKIIATLSYESPQSAEFTMNKANNKFKYFLLDMADAKVISSKIDKVNYEGVYTIDGDAKKIINAWDTLQKSIEEQDSYLIEQYGIFEFFDLEVKDKSLQMADGGKTENSVTFSIDNQELDEMLHNSFESQLEYNDAYGDVLYILPKREFNILIDMADGRGFDVDYENSKDSVIIVYNNYANGGKTEKTMDLFEDYDNIPSSVKVILEKYNDEFEEGNYKGLAKAKKELENIGYTFDYGLGGGAYDLRKINEQGEIMNNPVVIKVGDTIRIKDGLNLGSLMNLEGQDLEVKNITKYEFASGIKKYYHVEYDGDKYEVREDFVDNERMEHGGYMANGGSIPNNYEDQTAFEIWGEWSLEQKRHFLEDHYDEMQKYGGFPNKSLRSLAESTYNDLPTNVKQVLEDHIETGQYAKGGETMSDKEMIEKLKKEFEGKDLYDDEILDEYSVKQFDSRTSEEEIDKFVNSKKKKFYVVPFDAGDDAYYYILVQKNKMQQVGYMAHGGETMSNEALIFDILGKDLQSVGDKINELLKETKDEKWIVALKSIKTAYDNLENKISVSDQKLGVIEVHSPMMAQRSSINDDLSNLDPYDLRSEASKTLIQLAEDIRYVSILEDAMARNSGFENNTTRFFKKVLDISKNAKKEFDNIKDKYYKRNYADGGYMAEGGEVNSKVKELQTNLSKEITKIQDEVKVLGQYYNVGSSSRKSLGEAFNKLNSAAIDILFGTYNKDFKTKEKMEDGGMMADGGSIEEQNNDMLQSKIKEIKHHADELKSIVNKTTEVEAWVVAKIERASTDLSDITHYLDGEKGKSLEMPFEKGGINENSKIPMKSIKIYWAEGDNSKYDKFPKEYKSWEEANDALMPILEDFKNSGGGGYNKVKFGVFFEDGETYDQARLDINQKEDNPESGNAIGHHIYDYITEMLKQEKLNKQTRDELESFISKYDLGIDTSEKGAAAITVALDNGKITVFRASTPNDNSSKLLEFEAKPGDYDKIWQSIQKIGKLKEAGGDIEYAKGGDTSINTASKVNAFLDAVRLSDNSIKLKDLTVEASPRGNWVVYEHGKPIVTLNANMLDEETIRTYNLEHHAN